MAWSPDHATPKRQPARGEQQVLGERALADERIGEDGAAGERERNGHAVSLGPRPSLAGEAVLGSLTRLFDEATSLGVQLGELAGDKVVTLRVAASDYLGEALLLPVLRRMFAALGTLDASALM